MSEDIILRKLVIKAFHITKVVFSDTNDVNETGTMMINKAVLEELLKAQPLIDRLDVQIIRPGEHDCWTNAILDFIPVSTKVSGKIGEGVTHTLTGVYVMLTGVDSNGVQLSRYGASEGILRDHVCLNRAGTPGTNDFIVSFDVTLAAGAGTARSGPTAAHQACDAFCQIFRNKMKKLNGQACTESHEYVDRIRAKGKKVAIIKQVPGQGCMFDTQFLGAEPSGVAKGRSVIDIGHVPVVLTPNEYRDGAIHAMC